MRLFTRFGIHPREIEIVDRKNSGTREFDNYSLEEICHKINDLTCEFDSWIYDQSDNQELELRKYSFLDIAYKGKCTYLGGDYNRKKNMENIQKRNTSNFSTEAIIECLKEAHERFKLPMIELLKKYYMIKYNTKTEVDINILKSLGFKPCSACCPNSYSIE